MTTLKTNLSLFFAICLMGLNAGLYGQTVPITFHFDPPVDNFEVVRLVGSFNGWNNADNNLAMTDTDGDGVFILTTPLAMGVDHNYKFVLDADWGQSFTDPDNPRVNVADNNNSIITVTDPNITYLLPRGITSAGDQYVDISDTGEPLRAVIDFTAGNPIDLSEMVLTYDDVTIDNPGQYFDEATHELYYELPETPTIDEHTISLTVSSAIDTITKTATYRYDPSMVVYHVPTDFYFDTHNARNPFFTVDINAVSVMGPFNNWNNQFNPMQDMNFDGVWETTVPLEPHGWQYKFQVNGSLWVNDNDNPHFNPDNADNNWIEVIVDSLPGIKLLSPMENQVFVNDESLPESINLEALLRPGVLGEGVNEASLEVTLNGNVLTHAYDAETGQVSAIALNMESGVNTLTVSFANGLGESVSQTYTVGLFDPNTGFHAVDGIADVQYTPPSGMTVDELDIRGFHLAAIGTNHDSLLFTINMAEIGDRTRLGLLITNPVSDLVEDSLGLDLELPDWDTEGIFTILADPNSSLFNAERENRFQERRDPVTYGNYSVSTDAAALSENTFEFVLPLAYLDSLLGGWNQQRTFMLFSYAVSADGSGQGTEITAEQGGIDGPEEADIYDAAFIRSSFWQNRILSNFIPAGSAHGPRLTALDGIGRGQAILTATDVSDSLATFGPVITFLTPAVSYWYNSVDIAWTVSDSLTTSATVIFNGAEHEVLAENGVFTYPASLEEGENTVVVRAVGSNGFLTTSTPQFYTYVVNHNPSVFITAETNGRVMTLTANGFSPDSLNLSYLWWGDPDNPAPISILPFSYTSITRTIPDANGEYFFNVRAKDSENRTAEARFLITATDSGITAAGINDHAAWIDTAVFYEIYPRSFSEQGGFSGIQARIPDMVDLGINAVWLMPIFDGPTTHGYEITDYYAFEQDYGNAAEFENLVTELHDNGIRIILDFVVNHTAIGHRFMQNVFEYHEYSPWAEWYIWEGQPGNSSYEYFFDWASLPNLNHVNPDVRKYFIDVAKYWVENFDIDGYRCDVAWGVEERTPLFWPEWRQALKNIKPEVFLEAEASSAQTVYYDQRFDAANDWELRNRILEAIQGTNTIGAMDAELRRDYPSHARPFRFLENHDESRMAAAYDTERSKLAHTIIFMANGVPLIYSGGEVGELTGRGLIDWSDPGGVRPYFKRLVQIRKSFLSNDLAMSRISNSDMSDIYSFASRHDGNTLVTVANFRSTDATDLTVDLSGFAFEGDGPYYLSDLMSGEVITVPGDAADAVNIPLNGYEARVFYYNAHIVNIAEIPDEGHGIKEFELRQNYPNPFNPATTIRYSLPTPAEVTLTIYDITGREVTRLVRASQGSGNYQIMWNGQDRYQNQVASGIYFYRFMARDAAGSIVAQETRRMLLVK
ncbi:MAG: T9SS type A sorting domain-containing protein [Candidatus Marinimicrobia bacterium]|nr:T9SS type A sorting domain-containing protein [Candidatus Neomarinimicrobiota bacterium]